MSNPTSTEPTTTTTNTSSQEFTTVPIDGNHADNETTAADATATTKTPVGSSSSNKEKTSNKMMRTTKNAWRRAVGCCKKSTPRTKIHLKEHQIIKRQKAFGMEYIQLLRSNEATEEQLKRIVQSCMDDIDGLVEEIALLENKIEQVSEETQNKIKPKPLTGSDKKPIYPESGLYVGGDPSIEDDEEPKTPPEGAFSITSAEDNDDEDNSSNNPNQESWMPPPPATAPPAVPTA